MTLSEQLDNALNEALELCANTTAQQFYQTVKVSNIKQHYANNGIYWPALDAKQREVFDRCERIALEIGIER